MIYLALALAAIDLDRPIAIGPPAGIEALARAARRCGLSVDLDKMDRVTAMLIGKKHSRRSIECTLKWKKRHRAELRLVPFFGEP